MSGRPVTGEVPPVSSQGLSNSNGVASGGGGAVPPNVDTAPQSFPMATVPRLPPVTPMDTSQAQETTNDTPKIPPLMGIRPNVSALNPPPPAQLPPSQALPSVQLPPAVPVATQQATPHPVVTPLGGNMPGGGGGGPATPVVATATNRPTPPPPSIHALDGPGQAASAVVSNDAKQGIAGASGKQMRTKDDEDSK